MNSYTLPMAFLFLLLASCKKSELISDDTDPVQTNLTTSVNTWTKYCGWHYFNGTIPSWGGWVREYSKDGFGLFITDPNTNLIDQSLLETSFQELSNLSSEIDLLQLTGGLGSAKDTTRVINWMNFIESDHGQKWKDIVYEQSLKLTMLPNAADRVYWQVGNEISSPSYSRTIRYWQGQAFGAGMNYDSFVIPYYVENFLAPTVEAIDKASLKAYGEVGKINICLGSLTNARSTAAQIFLDELLNYEIVGTNSPSLKKKKISDLIHIITIHYTAGTASTAEWEDILTHYKSYSGTGRIKGVWSTEEVGIQTALGGAGGAIGSVATFRYLEWAIKNNFSSREVRTNYYGWATGEIPSTTDTFNQFIFDFLGDSKLANIPKSSTSIQFSTPVEFHSFITEDHQRKVLGVFPERTQSRPNSEVNSIVLKKGHWQFKNSINAYLYSEEGIIIKNFEIKESSSEIEVIFNSPIQLDYYSGLLVTLD